MGQIKIATFNAEWMASLFGAVWLAWQPPNIPTTFPGKKLGDIELEPIEDVHGLCRRIAGVIRDTGAHIIGLQEAPPRPDQLQVFVDQFLDGDYVVHQSNPRWQSISALVHRSVANRVTGWQSTAPNFARMWDDVPYYPWGTFGVSDRKQHDLYRRPLLLNFKPSAVSRKELRLAVLHTKSKFSLLKTREQWEQRNREAILDALDTRAKISAEVSRVRSFLDGELTVAGADVPRSFVLMGDLNDGPFAELMEREFMIHNIVDELVGSLLQPDKHLRHAMTPDVLSTASTASFPDPLQNGEIVTELIDHILVSPAIWQRKGDFRLRPDSCQVETAVFDRYNQDTGPVRKRHLRPSDHKPVSAVLEY